MAMRQRIITQSNFALLFGILGLTVLGPIVWPVLWARAVLGILVIISLLLASFRLSDNGKALIPALLLASLTVSSWVLAFWAHTRTFNLIHFEMAAYGVSLLFLLTVCAIIRKDVYSGLISANRICGAVCLYLLIGFAFAIVHMMIDLADPAAYNCPQTVYNSPQNNPARADSASFLAGHRRYPLFVYFSFCTLSTVGYGDVVPVSRYARTMSWLEAVCGQLYLTVTIAQLVGLHIAAKSVGMSQSLNASSTSSQRERELERVGR